MFLKIQYFFVFDEEVVNKVKIEYQCYIYDHKQAKYIILSSTLLELHTEQRI